jgi:hypothetical protein
LLKMHFLVDIDFQTCIIRNMSNTEITENDLDLILDGEKTHAPKYHANHLISDKNIDPKSPNFGKKGESRYLKNGDQYYIKYKGDEDFTRCKWWQLDSVVSEGSYGVCLYKGINASIRGKEGELFYTNKRWVFVYDGEKYPLVNPESTNIGGI